MPRPPKCQRNRSASRITMVQAIICDFDFTLADSSPGVVACVNEALAGLGLPPASAEHIHVTIGLSLPHTLQALTGIVEPALATAFTRRFVAHADQVMHGLTCSIPGSLRPSRHGVRQASAWALYPRSIGIGSSAFWL